MNYFFRGLKTGNAKAIATMIAYGIYAVAVIDIISTGISAPGLFNGYWFYTTAVLSFLVPIGYWIFDATKRKKIANTKQFVNTHAEKFEAQREKEIRQLIANDREFATHCYMCVHFNPDTLVCKKKFSKDIIYNRIKEIKVNNKIYCLYWDTENS